MKGKKKLTLIHLVIPSIIIFSLYFIAHTTSNEMLKGVLIFGSILLYFPILFFIQGLVCGLFRDNILLSFGISSAAFMLNYFIWIKEFRNMLDHIYLMLYYLIIGFIGYGLVRLVQQIVDYRKNKAKTL